VPEQLALQFNEAASRGQRDNLVIDALQRFLAQREEPVRPRAKTALARDVSAIDRVSNDREALELIRYHAAAILQIADKATGLRKGPKAVRRVRRSTRGRRA
jgi:hypothetical protein